MLRASISGTSGYYCMGDVGHLLYRCTTSAVVFLHCSLMLVTCYIAVRLLLLSSYIAPWCWSLVISLYDFCCCLLTLLPDVGHVLYRCRTSAVVFLHCSLMLVTCYIAVRLLLLSSYIAPWCWSRVISLYDFCCCLLTLLPDVGHLLYRCTTSAVVFLHCTLMLVTCYIAVRLLLLSSYIAPWCWSLVISLYAFCCCLLTLLPVVGHFPCLNSYTGLQVITESNLNCPLLHIVLLQYINHLILQVSCTFLTSPDNSDHLPHSSFLFPELNWTWASVLSLLLHPSFGMNSQPLWNLVKVLHLSVKI